PGADGLTVPHSAGPTTASLRCRPARGRRGLRYDHPIANAGAHAGSLFAEPGSGPVEAEGALSAEGTSRRARAAASLRRGIAPPAPSTVDRISRRRRRLPLVLEATSEAAFHPMFGA